MSFKISLIPLADIIKLITKLLFIRTEIQKRKAEIEKIKADTDYNRAQTNRINADARIVQAKAYLDILKESQSSGINLNLENELLELIKYHS